MIFYDEEAAQDLARLKASSSSKIISATAKHYRPSYARDIFIAFFLDVFWYFLIGLAGYIGYHLYTDPNDGEIKPIPDNYFMIFTSTNIPALVGRILLCVKITICFPVVFRALRSTFLLAIFPWKWLDLGEGSEAYERKKLLEAKNKKMKNITNIEREEDEGNYSSQLPTRPITPQDEGEHIKEPSLLFFLHIVPTSFVFMALTTVFAVFYRNVGVILSVGGSFCGLIYIYFLPCCLEIKLQYDMYVHKNYSSMEVSLLDQKHEYKSNKNTKSKLSLCINITLHCLMILYGLGAFILQFLPGGGLY